MGISHCRNHSRQLVELRSAGLERSVGMGPSGECQFLAMADGHRISAFGFGARTSRDVAGVESQFGDRHI